MLAVSRRDELVERGGTLPRRRQWLRTLTLLGAKFGLHSHPGDFPFVAEIMEGFVAADPPCCGTTSTHSIPAAGIGTAAPTAESISEHGGRQWLGAHTPQMTCEFGGSEHLEHLSTWSWTVRSHFNRTPTTVDRAGGT